VKPQKNFHFEIWKNIHFSRKILFNFKDSFKKFRKKLSSQSLEKHNSKLDFSISRDFQAVKKTKIDKTQKKISQA